MQIIEQQLNRKDINITTDLIDETNADSLDMVEIIVDVENELQCRQYQMKSIKTLAYTWRYNILCSTTLPYHPIGGTHYLPQYRDCHEKGQRARSLKNIHTLQERLEIIEDWCEELEVRLDQLQENKK